MQSTERWLPVVGYEGLYEVSDLGRVKSLARVTVRDRRGAFPVPERILKQSRSKTGHLRVHLYKDKQRKERGVHQLVASAYVPGRAPGLEVCHNDGDPAHNLPANLRWDTHSSNLLDAVAHGRNAMANKTRCVHGHEFTDESTGTDKSGYRYCRTCRREQQRKSRTKQRSIA